MKFFEILIGQDFFKTLPAQFTVIAGDHSVSVNLEEFKNWLNDIWDSQGNRSDKAYKAKKNIDEFFSELLYPFLKENIKNDSST